MKYFYHLLIALFILVACEQTSNSREYLNDLDVTNDVALEELTIKYYNEGAHPFARPFIEQFKKTSELRKGAISEEMNISDYRSELLNLSLKLKDLDSATNTNPFSSATSDSFNGLDMRIQLSYLMFYENYLINEILTKYFEYFYSFDIAKPMLKLQSDNINLGDSLNAELFLTVSRSALIFLTKAQIIDNTGKVEWQAQLETNWRTPNKIQIGYKPVTSGTKTLKGTLIFPHEGNDIKLEYERDFKVKSR